MADLVFCLSSDDCSENSSTWTLPSSGSAGGLSRMTPTAASDACTKSEAPRLRIQLNLVRDTYL